MNLRARSSRCDKPSPVRLLVNHLSISWFTLAAVFGCGGPPADVDDASAEGASSDVASIDVSDGGVDGATHADASFDAGLAACSSGAEQANSGGLEGPLGTAVVNLCRLALGCPSSWQPSAPPALTGGTPNQKLLYHVWDYGYAMRFGDATSQSTARVGLVGFFDAQKTFGHYAPTANANEVLTTSHYEIWSNGATCARLLAAVYADAPVLQATGEWWRGERALYDLLERGGSIDAPGARFSQGGGGPSQLRDVIYAMLRGAPLPGNAGNPSSAWWSDYYNVAAWQLREVLRLGDDLQGSTQTLTTSDLPALRDPLYVRTNGSDYVFEFPVMRGALEPLFWVAHIGGTTTYAPYVSGTPVNEPTPAPALPGAKVFVVPGTP